MNWASQAFLNAIFSHVLDSERPELDRKILSALIFVHLLNHQEPESANSAFRYFGSLTAPAIDTYKPYLEGYTEQKWSELFGYYRRTPILELFSDEERYRMEALFNFRNMVNGNLDTLSIILFPQYGGEITAIPYAWVRIILESVWLSEQYASEGGLAVWSSNEAGGWSAPYLGVLNNVPLWLSPFDIADISEIRGIKSYNFGVSPFGGVR